MEPCRACAGRGLSARRWSEKRRIRQRDSRGGCQWSGAQKLAPARILGDNILHWISPEAVIDFDRLRAEFYQQNVRSRRNAQRKQTEEAEAVPLVPCSLPYSNCRSHGATIAATLFGRS
jgi:hypothetical protein